MAAAAARGAQNPPAAPAAPIDEWERYYSIDLATPNAQPVLLTTTDGIIEDQTSVAALERTARRCYYCTNAKDIERRHIWAVPVAGGTPQQITTGDGIETYPAPLASGKALATLSADWKMPQSVGIWPLAGRRRRVGAEDRLPDVCTGTSRWRRTSSRSSC